MKKATKFTSPGRSRVREIITHLIFCTAGCFLYSVGVNMFTAPNQIAPGGATGLAIVINYVADVIPIGTANLLINIPLFLLAWKFLGFKFIVGSAGVTVLLSAMLDITGTFLPAYQGDELLACFFGGVLNGAGLALILMRGFTSGGTDIMGRLFRLKWPHMSMGRVILAADLMVIAISGIVFKSIESVLYAIITVFVSSRAIDYILYGTGNGKMLMVFTEHAEDIAKAITGQTPRGVSILPVKGGYTGKDKNMVICAVRSSEVSRINKIINSVDPNTFTIISEAGEILGEGFKSADENNP